MRYVRTSAVSSVCESVWLSKHIVSIKIVACHSRYVQRRRWQNCGSRGVWCRKIDLVVSLRKALSSKCVYVWVYSLSWEASLSRPTDWRLIDRTAGWVRYGQKWNRTAYGHHRSIFNQCDVIGEQSNQSIIMWTTFPESLHDTTQLGVEPETPWLPLRLTCH